MEGVMMRGNRTVVSTIRKSSGELTSPLPGLIYPATKQTAKDTGLPFIRGGINMIESMIVGIKALMESAEYVEFEESESKFDKWMKRNSATSLPISSCMFGHLCPGNGRQAFLCSCPTLWQTFCPSVKKRHQEAFLANIMEGMIRIIIFLAYVWLVSKNKDQAGVPVPWRRAQKPYLPMRTWTS